jgi:hypothetical protein
VNETVSESQRQSIHSAVSATMRSVQEVTERAEYLSIDITSVLMSYQELVATECLPEHLTETLEELTYQLHSALDAFTYCAQAELPAELTYYINNLPAPSQVSEFARELSASA